MLGVNPYITFKGNCRQAIEFYKKVLNAEVVFMQTMGDSPMSDMGPAENIMHSTLKIGDSTVMMSDDPSPDGSAPGSNISLAIGLNDPARANQIFENLAKGGSIILPIQKTFWAEAFGMLTDQFGVRWMVNSDESTSKK